MTALNNVLCYCLIIFIALHRSRHSSPSAARSELGLSTLSSRRKLHLAQSVFKCLSSQSPSYLSQLFSTPSSSYDTQSSSSRQLNLPTTKSSFGQKAFSFTGASLWRSLRSAIRETQTLTNSPKSVLTFSILHDSLYYLHVLVTSIIFQILYIITELPIFF